LGVEPQPKQLQIACCPLVNRNDELRKPATAIPPVTKLL